MIWTWYFAWTLTLVISIISETLTKFPSIMTELWRHKTEKWRVFSCFGRNSSLTCSTTSIFMNISQNACFIKTKHFAKFRTVTDRNDGVMTSSKFRRDVKKMMTSYLRQKWRNRLQTFQTVISCHSDRFCKVSMILTFGSWVLKIHLFIEREILMTSSTTLTDKVNKIWCWNLLDENPNTLFLLRVKFHYCIMCGNTILSHLKSSGTTPPHWPVSLCQNLTRKPLRIKHNLEVFE